MKTETMPLDSVQPDPFADSTHGLFGTPYKIWLALQSGQEKVIRWSHLVKQYGPKVRKQTGYDHASSVGFLSMVLLMRMRQYASLDEMLITRAFQLHDIPEGFLERDIIVITKNDNDDLQEYLSFEEWFRPLGEEMWAEMQRAFLLQFALNMPECFPREARNIAEQLAEDHRYDALFFDGAQRIDYLFYAYECHRERGIDKIFKDVTKYNYEKIEQIASQLPGFREVIWTPDRREHIQSMLAA